MALEIPDHAMTPSERKAFFAKIAQDDAGAGKRGHFARPGSGPQGETCKSCKHLTSNRLGKTYLKCGKNRARWTGGEASDVRARDPACSGWEAEP